MAAKKVRWVFKRFFLILNLVLSAIFLIACLVPYLNPAQWWFMGLIGLAFPYLALLLIFFCIFWGVTKPAYLWIPVLTLLIGYKQIGVLFGTNKSVVFSEKKDSTHIRVVNWNIRSLEGLSNKSEKKRIDRATIPETIIAQNPDIICLQEFNNSTIQNNIAPFLSRYHYYYFSKDFKRSKQGYNSGSIIFSKYPIVDSGRIPFPDPQGGSLIFTDIKTHQKIIRVFTTHLQSYRFKQGDYDNMEEIKNTGDKTLPASKSLLQKMKFAYQKRGEQANIVRDALDATPFPSVVCGDFNDVPNSYTYFHIRKNWQDAFLATSLGIGRSYLTMGPTLRIDYILPDNNFSIHQFDLVDEDLSDHLMLVTDLSLK